ncbi:MAG TPA: response regulator transcription factor [Bacteroidota bacterium]|nr:response regulator transcription factor [Bacteroidota bacterium]
MKVLLVDDDSVTRQMVATQLKHLGHEVTTAGNGREGWCAYEATLPDVVITDLVMPEESGIELCRRIRSARRVQYTYITVLTSLPGKSAFTSAMEAGADDFMEKPCSAEKLLVRLRVAERVLQLQGHVNVLEGFLPICSYCKRIRNENDDWHALEAYVGIAAHVTVSDTLCPDCATVRSR